MRARLLSMRPSVTRTSRHDPRGAAIESVAAEFALLAQRRARLARQLDLLGRQIATASASLDAVHGRMMLLAQRMDGIDPSLRPVSVAPLLPSPVPVPTLKMHGKIQTRSVASMVGVQPQPQADSAAAPRLLGLPRALRPTLRRRTFLPE